MHSSHRCRRSHSSRRLRLERLEDRSVPSAYSLIDLGTLGGLPAHALDINEAGQAVGQSANAAGQPHAFLWDDGVMIDLGTIGGTTSGAGALNDAGQVVGSSRVAPGNFISDSFLWENGVMTGLGVTATQGTFAAGINNAGQVVGAWYDGHHWRAYLWDNGALSEPFPGRAADINEAGQVAGEWEITRGYPVAAIWDSKQGPRELGILPGGVFSGAAALNDFGQVVGWSESFNGDRAVLWDNGQMIDLGPGAAADINNAGQIVGHSSIWIDGVRANLNELVPAGSGLTIWSAAGINDAGQIVASAVDAQGFMHAVLLNPLSANTPAITINDVSVSEGNNGITAANFTVTISNASNQTVTVQFLTANGTATAGSDYQSTGGTLTFAPGQTSQTITVTVIGDRIPEPNRTFFVNLSNAGDAIIGDSQGVGTIIDDEPRISINDVTLTEGSSGTKLFTFTVTLSVAYDQTVTMSYRTANGTATSTGGQADYVSQTRTLTFNAGQTQKTISVAVNGDTRKEKDETFFVDLFGNSSSSLITKSRGIGTILNDD
jgi:probable HAF family extracellular repeat protein